MKKWIKFAGKYGLKTAGDLIKFGTDASKWNHSNISLSDPSKGEIRTYTQKTGRKFEDSEKHHKEFMQSYDTYRQRAFSDYAYLLYFGAHNLAENFDIDGLDSAAVGSSRYCEDWLAAKKVGTVAACDIFALVFLDMSYFRENRTEVISLIESIVGPSNIPSLGSSSKVFWGDKMDCHLKWATFVDMINYEFPGCVKFFFHFCLFIFYLSFISYTKNI